MTLYVACLTLDQKRIGSKRYDCCFCAKYTETDDEADDADKAVTVSDPGMKRQSSAISQHEDVGEFDGCQGTTFHVFIAALQAKLHAHALLADHIHSLGSSAKKSYLSRLLVNGLAVGLSKRGWQVAVVVIFLAIGAVNAYGVTTLSTEFDPLVRLLRIRSMMNVICLNSPFHIIQDTYPDSSFLRQSVDAGIRLFPGLPFEFFVINQNLDFADVSDLGLLVLANGSSMFCCSDFCFIFSRSYKNTLMICT